MKRLLLAAMLSLLVIPPTMAENKYEYSQKVDVWNIMGYRKEAGAKRVCFMAQSDSEKKAAIFISKWHGQPHMVMQLEWGNWNIQNPKGTTGTAFIRFSKNNRQTALFPVTVENEGPSEMIIKDTTKYFLLNFEEADFMEIFMPGDLEGLNIPIPYAKDMISSMLECVSVNFEQPKPKGKMK